MFDPFLFRFRLVVPSGFRSGFVFPVFVPFFYFRFVPSRRFHIPFSFRGRLRIVIAGAIRACQQAGQEEMVVALTKETVEASIVTCRICYSWALKVYGEGERWADAAGLLRGMSDLGIDLDPFTYSLAIAASRHRRDSSSSGSSSSSSSSDRLSSAVALLEEMRRVGLKPELLSYVTAIRACAETGDSELAVHLLEDMSAAGVKRDRTAYAGAITACCAAGNLEKATSLLEGMLAEGVPADKIASNVLMRAYAETGQWEEAISALRLLQGSPTSPAPTADSFGSAVAACAAAGRAVEALGLLLEMLDSGVTPVASSYSDTVKAYGWNSDRGGDSYTNNGDIDKDTANDNDNDTNNDNDIDDDIDDDFNENGDALRDIDRDRVLDRRRADVREEVDRVAAAWWLGLGLGLDRVHDGANPSPGVEGGVGMEAAEAVELGVGSGAVGAAAIEKCKRGLLARLDADLKTERRSTRRTEAGAVGATGGR